ncbi:nucleoside-diphosphate-sugar epimerase [Labedella gwakjiensis]|uniref:NAD-dependent epimerase/dehydratase family protein n=1 Tax=Labedella gwakjiensis TaxID=390269 RepID=A0A2P8GRF4_9MICO|nr:NmrA family NAD(P)-binding protein [Labedella gwakjiensis]PSL36537.1 nucleoside-diphosphate-sugar epimerase [Labedella gwakjiensis]RUQ85548.1 NAD-dependent epimerase/dehydratase family protein [Labedella gwakjiensis]
MTTTVLVAGATGDLGRRIVRALGGRDAWIRVLTRPGSDSAHAMYGDADGIEIVEASYTDAAALLAATAGVDVVISAVNGLRPVIVDAQSALLAAAVRSGVSRFIPSDYSADYRSISPGSNRNFELRREFAATLDAADIRATSVLNGAFADMLTGQAPLISFSRHRVMFWSSADQVLDFTTKDDVARTVASVALDDRAPRVVEVAGSSVTARQIAETLTSLTGTSHRLQWAGTTGTLAGISSVMRRMSRDDGEAFPAWQGMQYFVSMFSGQAQLRNLDNDRYGPVPWTSVRDVLSAHLADGAREPVS